MGQLYYCKKCGRQVIEDIEDKLICDICESKVYPVPEKYLGG